MVHQHLTPSPSMGEGGVGVGAGSGNSFRRSQPPRNISATSGLAKRFGPVSSQRLAPVTST
jgi:hypothetical protein